MTAHFVYRCLDAQQEVIYVGATKDVAARMVQHGVTSFWAPQVVKVTVRVFSSKEIALDEERQTIKREQPTYNLHGKKTGRTTWTEADCDAEITKLVSRGIGHGSRRALDKLFTNYLVRFGRPHALSAEIARRLDDFDKRWRAEQARRSEVDAIRRQAFEEREAAELAEHDRVCCACRYGVEIDDDIVRAHGDPELGLPGYRVADDELVGGAVA